MTEDALFAAALRARDAAERSALLDRLCAGQPELRRRVEDRLRRRDAPATLAAAADSSAPTRDYAPAAPHPAAPADPQGTRIGPYRLLRPLGEGGMGTVWLAEQTEPVRRQVALKLIKAGMDSRPIIARFEQERQALARMDHPHIARVLDAGGTADGRPFFVMELVEGEPLTRFCDRRQLPLRERLALFVSVCQAVQHAHQKGIIHRDLKPSNILVALYDGKAVPKVIDFGIAKATGPGVGGGFTEAGAFVGTPEYVAPEQADAGNHDIDTRADVYSLGVILYELLTGGPPFAGRKLREAGLSAMLRTVREVEPPRPSARLAAAADLPAIAARRGSEPKRLLRQVRGELDWIAMKCLEKERGRRYETANGLALDVQRYLADEPVSAGPPSAAYRLRKFVRRHRGPVLAAGLLLLALVGGIVGTSLGMREAHRQRDDARDQRDRAVRAEEEAARRAEEARRAEAELRAVLTFFQNNVLAANRPQGQNGGQGVGITLRAAVDSAEPRIAPTFRGQPRAEADIRNTLGGTYWYLGEAKLALAQFERSAALRREALGPDHPLTLESLNNLGMAYNGVGRPLDGIPLLEKALRGRRELLGDDDPSTLLTADNLGTVYHTAGRMEEARRLYEESFHKRKARHGLDHPDTLTSMAHLAAVYLDLGRLGEAVPLAEEALRRRTAVLGEGHVETVSSIELLAHAYQTAGRPADALPLFRKALQDQRKTLGPDHPGTLQTQRALAQLYRDADRPQESVKLLEEVRKRLEARLGRDHPDTLATLTELGLAYRGLGRHADALPLFQETVQKYRQLVGEDHPNYLNALKNVALTCYSLDRLADALPLAEDVLRRQRRLFGSDHPMTLSTMSIVGVFYHKAGRSGEGLRLLEEALKGQKACRGPNHPETLHTLKNLAVTYLELGRAPEAVAAGEETVKRWKALYGEDHQESVNAMGNLATAYRAAGRPRDAVPLLEKVLRARKASPGAGHPDTLAAMIHLGLAYGAADRTADAIALLDVVRASDPRRTPRVSPAEAAEMAAIYERAGRWDRAESLRRSVAANARAGGDDSPASAEALAALGRNLLEQKKYADAEPLLLQDYRRAPPQDRARRTEALRRLVRLYDAWGKKEQADEWRKKLKEEKP